MVRLIVGRICVLAQEYLVVYIDAIWQKVKRDTIRSEAFYILMGLFIKSVPLPVPERVLLLVAVPVFVRGLLPVPFLRQATISRGTIQTTLVRC